MVPASGLLLPENFQPVNEAAADTSSLLLPELAQKHLTAAILRLDRIHPVISGNKWFKLRYHLEGARRQGCTSIVSFGGAYSNHLVATACAALQQGFNCAGIVRGENSSTLSHTLLAAQTFGMTLHFTPRQIYAEKENSPFIHNILEQYPHHYLIPEGGAGEEGVRGCRDMLPLAENAALYTHVMCSIGTGTMFRGLAESLAPGQQLVGIPVLKLSPDSFLVQSLQQYGEARQKDCVIRTGFDWGGYAKRKPALLDFMNLFYARTRVPTDFVYTAKLMWAFMQLAEQDFFPPGSRILLVHSGGLQGNASLPPGALRYEDNSLT